ncbi:MAG TPA: hypothetical protein VNS09_17160 [Solirubrobacter sp.]|nr:hypothetical protein [Solirubrobacter sp.]
MRRAEPVAGLGGVGLLVAAFTGGAGFGPTDVVLVAIGLLALAVPVVSLAAKGPAAPMAVAVLVSAFGWIAVVLGAIRLTGEWLPLAAALVAWVGSWLSMRDESTPGAAAPDIPRRPAPPKITANAEP